MSEERAWLEARVMIRGRVQGVYFRAGLKREADRIGVTGWVRNLPDGSVEALLRGSRPDLETLIAWSRVGPAGAAVDAVDVRWASESPTPGSGPSASVERGESETGFAIW